jgi:hypothetical protein
MFSGLLVVGSERTEITHTPPMLNAEFYLNMFPKCGDAPVPLESDF